jgi:hypothetical protein
MTQEIRTHNNPDEIKGWVQKGKEIFLNPDEVFRSEKLMVFFQGERAGAIFFGPPIPGMCDHPCAISVTWVEDEETIQNSMNIGLGRDDLVGLSWDEIWERNHDAPSIRESLKAMFVSQSMQKNFFDGVEHIAGQAIKQLPPDLKKKLDQLLDALEGVDSNDSVEVMKVLERLATESDDE